SDVWALGVVLYEMLAGEAPFKGSYPEAIFYAIKNETPAPLSGGGRDIPDPVQRSVSRALAKDPAERYQSAREMARELRFLQGRSLPLDLRTEAVDVQRALAAAQRPRRKLWPRAAAAAGVLAIATAATYAWLARPLPRTPIAVVPMANHTGEAELDAYRFALTQALITELDDSPNLRVSPYFRLLEIVRRYLGGQIDPSSQEAIQSIAAQSGASVLIIPSVEYKDGGWRAHADLRNVSTGTTAASIDTEPISSALPKETVQRLVPFLASAIQRQFPPRWPHRVAPRSAEGRFRTLEAARAFEAGLNAYEQME